MHNASVNDKWKVEQEEVVQIGDSDYDEVSTVYKNKKDWLGFT